MSSTAVSLGDFTNIKTGKLDANASSDDGQYPFFTCAQKPLRISSFSYDCECVLIAGNGDLNVKYYEGKFDAYQRTYIVEVLPEKKNKLHLRYAYHFLETYLDTLREQSIGGIIKYIKMGNLTNAQIPLPPLAEQKRIAGILDAADALRAKRREALAQLDSLLQSTFLDLFGDPVTNPMGWPTASFDDCIQDLTSSAIKIPKSDFQLGGQWQIIDQSQNEIAGYSDTGPPFTQTLPAVVFGDHTRCVKLVRQPFLLGADGAKLLVPRKQMLSVYLSYLLPLLKLPDLGYSRHMREVKRLVYPLPPLPLQKRFATIVESIERQKAAQRGHLAELDAFFAALQHRAFRGEL